MGLRVFFFMMCICVSGTRRVNIIYLLIIQSFFNIIIWKCIKIILNSPKIKSWLRACMYTIYRITSVVVFRLRITEERSNDFLTVFLFHKLICSVHRYASSEIVSTPFLLSLYIAYLYTNIQL